MVWLHDRIVGIDLGWPDHPSEWREHVSGSVSIQLPAEQVCELARARLPRSLVLAIELSLGPGRVDAECLRELAPDALILEGEGVDDRLLSELRSIPLRELYLFETGATPRGLEGLAGFSELRVLSLVGAETDEASLRAIAALDLEVLDLSVTPTNDIEALAPLDHLRVLHLSETPVRDLSRLRSFPRLQALGLRGLRLPEGSLRVLTHTPRVRRLDLTNAWIVDADTAHIARLPELVELGMNGTRIGDDGVAQLSACESLRDLDLSRTGITNVGVGHLRRLPHLRNLALMATEIDDGAASFLAELAGLRYLEVRHTELGDEGLRRLESLPLLFLDARFTRATTELLRAFADRGVRVCEDNTTSTFPICG